MGLETRCMAEIDDWTGDGRLLLETDQLIFRGARRLAVERAQIRSAVERDGWLEIEHPEGLARFDLGASAAGWVKAILNPRSLFDKLGVKQTSTVALVGEFSDGFPDELRTRAQLLDQPVDGMDIIFLRVESADDLRKLGPLVDRIHKAGSIWVVHPKGRPDLKHEVIASAAREAGLVDNKSARFSATHSAIRFVIPVALRGGVA